MKIRFTTTLVLTIICITGFSQKSLIELDIHNKKISYFRNLEKKLGSQTFNTGQTYIAGTAVAQPEVYLRKEKNLPDLLVYYTFFKKDSLISEINYEWDVENFEKKDNNTKSLDFERNLINQYNYIVDLISTKYGKSEVEGSLDDIVKINSPDGLKRSDTWKPNDSFKIYSYTTISNFYKKEGFVTVNPTHRIRVYITNLKGDKPEKLSPAKIKILDDKFKSFMTLLAIENYSNENIEDIKKLSSDKVKYEVTIDILKRIKAGIQTDKKLELYMNGLQIMRDGNYYPMLQYKYSDDTSSNPKEYFMVVFDKDDTIIGIQPRKRK